MTASQDKIYLAGQSWGTTLGVMAVQQRPDLVLAFVGTGQMVSQLASDRIFYEDTLAWAETTGNQGLVDQFRLPDRRLTRRCSLRDRTVARAGRVSLRSHRQLRGLGADVGEPVDQRAHIDRSGIRSSGRSLRHLRRAVPALQDVDFRKTATEFEVPMFFVQERMRPAVERKLFADWYPMIQAPVKDMVVFDSSGHRPWSSPTSSSTTWSAPCWRRRVRNGIGARPRPT